jgi:hypothetical protein
LVTADDKAWRAPLLAGDIKLFQEQARARLAALEAQGIHARDIIARAGRCPPRPDDVIPPDIAAQIAKAKLDAAE